jgi:DNA-binding NtrC family response regulator/tetratricopeptide (TPR) repeat protein
MKLRFKRSPLNAEKSRSSGGIAGLRLQRPLGRGGRNLHFLAREQRAGQRRLWTVRWLPGTAGSAAAILRADLCEFLSTSHPALALPERIGHNEDGGRFYLLRRYIPGSDLATATRGLSPRELLPWLLAAAEALAVLHRLRLAHGNLKSANLLVPRAALFRRRPQGPKMILADPAWWPPGPAPREDGGTGSFPGTQRTDAYTAESDLFALGCVFYELLTGQALPIGDQDFALPLVESDADVPLDLQRLVARLVDPAPERRYGDASALASDLRRLSGEHAAPPYPPPECFIGRSDELRRALAHLEGPAGSVLAVSGEAGTGKSAFLRRLAHEVELRGRRTTLVSCHPGSSLPMTPLGELTGVLLAQRPTVPGGRTEDRLAPLRARYRRLFGEFPTRKGGGSVEDEDRHRFVENLVELALDACGHERTVLLVDEAHFADPVTIEFLARLTRRIGAARSALNGDAWVSLVVSFRTESPFRAPLRPLLAALDAASGSELELGPLSAAEVAAWVEMAAGEHPDAAERVHSTLGLGGRPSAVRDAIRLRGSTATRPVQLASGLSALYAAHLASLGEEKREVVAYLAVLGRPATADLLAALLDLRPAQVSRAVSELIEDGTVTQEGEEYCFRHGSFPNWLLETIEGQKRRRMHQRAAEVLERRRSPARAVAHHWLESEMPERGLKAALAAARELVRAHEDHAALRFYHAVLALLRGDDRLRLEVAEEAADSHARTGEYARAVEVLERLAPRLRKGSTAGRIEGRLGICYHRLGEVDKAASHLRRGLRLLRGGSTLPSRLRLESELAEIANHKGDYTEAEAICRRALQSLSAAGAEARDAEVRREEMVLLGTLAHLMLRRFRYAEAREFFEKSLKAGEAVGMVPERALILSNLGTLHVQESRLREAVGCFITAKQHSATLGDDQSLAVLESNLAVLHARLGEPGAADQALRLAALHDSRCDSPRIHFLRLHSEGLANLALGRYASAVESLHAAIAMGEEIADQHLVAFDRVHLGECHLLQGDLKSARQILELLLARAERPPPPAVAAASARLAVVAAAQSDFKGFRKALAKAQRVEHGIAYLDAWNQVFLGWAARLLGRTDEAKEQIERANAFFAFRRLPPGEIHSAVELAAAEAESGEVQAAAERLRKLRARFRCGEGPLSNPMLCARLLLYHAKLLFEQSPASKEEAAALIAEAESWLIGRRLRDLEALARSLRRRVRPAGRPRSLRLSGGEPAVTPSTFTARSLLGVSATMRSVALLVRQVAPSNLPVLIRGETGTGKEIVARALHGESPRRAGPFVSVSCAAFPQELLEAELFGYVRGAFSGAETDHLGLLASAAGGTFFFDEVAELPLGLQGKLLRFLDRSAVRPLGASEETRVEVRLLFSTSQDLAVLVEVGKFRRDLRFRLGTLEVRVPPLRERIEDIPLLAEHFAAQVLGGGCAVAFTEDALRALARHPWPGNARELRNVVLRLVLTRTEQVTAEDVALALEASAGGSAPLARLFSPALLRSRPLPDLLAQLEREHLDQLIADHGGDLAAAAHVLEIGVRALYNRMRRLDVRPRSGGTRQHP